SWTTPSTPSAPEVTRRLPRTSSARWRARCTRASAWTPTSSPHRSRRSSPPSTAPRGPRPPRPDVGSPVLLPEPGLGIVDRRGGMVPVVDQPTLRGLLPGWHVAQPFLDDLDLWVVGDRAAEDRAVFSVNADHLPAQAVPLDRVGLDAPLPRQSPEPVHWSAGLGLHARRRPLVRVDVLLLVLLGSAA